MSANAANEKQKQTNIVFSLRNASTCDECKQEIFPGGWLRREGETGLCMECADLGHLVYLPSGNAALTRRSTRYSRMMFVVLRWSRTRKQYERQGILVEEEALERAEAECDADAGVRQARQEREREKREALDQQYVTDFQKAILAQFPGCPPESAQRIALDACRKHSGRVGRSAAAKQFDPQAVELAVQAHVRHVHTRYDELLQKEWDRHEAREQVRGDVAEVMRKWRNY